MPAADFVFANPPCSRFSSSALAHFDEEDQSNLALFRDLQEVIDVTLRSRASALWWETGPHLYTKGRRLVLQTRDVLAREWGDTVTTLVVKIDPRWIGVPQQRPRCHIVHVRGDVAVPDVYDLRNWPIPERLWRWVYDRLSPESIREPRPVLPRSVKQRRLPDDVLDSGPAETARWLRETTNWTQGAPYLYNELDAYSLAVLSGRSCAWEGQNRWMSVQENAVLMGCPQDYAAAVSDDTEPSTALTLLSKGVSADVSAFVCENLVMPMVGGYSVDGEVDRWGDAEYEMTLMVRNSEPWRPAWRMTEEELCGEQRERRGR